MVRGGVKQQEFEFFTTGDKPDHVEFFGRKPVPWSESMAPETAHIEGDGRHPGRGPFLRFLMQKSAVT